MSKKLTQTSDIVFSADEIPNQNENKIVDITISGTGLPKFIISHREHILAIYSCMEVARLTKMKNGKPVFSIKLRCINQKNMQERCLAGFTIKSSNEDLFELSKSIRGKSEKWRFKLNLKYISAKDFDPTSG